MKSKGRFETNFSGTLDEWHSSIPEDVVDTIIKLLEIESEEVWHSPGRHPNFQQTAKEALWEDLARTVRIWGKPSPTQLKTSPADLKRHVTGLNKTFLKALAELRELHYQPLLDKGTMTKEFIVANQIRNKSKIMGSNSGDIGPDSNVSIVFIKQEHARNGEWGNYCPFDRELPQAIEVLETISSYVESVSKDSMINVKGRGIKKPAKESFDNLICQLCVIYKKFTGKDPVSWNTGTEATNANQFTGKIIPFLQAVLPHTSYGGKSTPAALQKKLLRMRNNPKFKGLREDNKK